MSSIHRKITAAYTVLAGLILLLSLFAFFDLLFLERQVNEGVVVTDLKDAILEVRRHEKNLFLYHNYEEMNRALKYANAALENLRSHPRLYETLSVTIDPLNLATHIAAYQTLLQRYQQETDPTLQHSLSLDLRKLGHRISETADGLANLEREALASSANKTQWALAGTILLMAVAAFLVGWRLSRAVVSPLRRLEKSLPPIAEGRFNHLETVSHDEEFVAFTNAFNRMLHELETRQRRIMQAEKLASLGTLVSGVAHELNNPLGNISSSCQLLMEELDSASHEMQMEWLQQIDGETDRARRIVLTLQDFGRQKDFHPESTIIIEVVKKSLLLLRNQIRKSAHVKLEIPTDLVVQADSQRLQQVFINLIRNAINVVKDEITVTIQASRCGETSTQLPENTQIIGSPTCGQQDNNHFIEIRVEDNGPGIAPEMMSKIFDPFFTTHEPGHGMGLGLYIVQEIIQEHGGCIAVSSLSGEGTCFIIRLPCEIENG